VSVGFRFMLGLRANVAGIPARPLAGWALTLLGLVLFAMVVRSWLTDPRLGGRHRSAGGHTYVARPTRRRSWGRLRSRWAGDAGISVQARRPMRASAAQSLAQCTPAALAGPPAKDQSAPLGQASDDDGESAALGGWPGQDRPVTVTGSARGRGQAALAGLTGTAESAEPVPAPVGSQGKGHHPASDRAADGLDAGVPDLGAPDAGAPDAGAPDAGGPDAGGPDSAAGEPGSRATSEFFYPAALRLLGVRRRASGSAGGAGSLVQRIEVAQGDYRIEVLLAEAPAGGRTGRSEKNHTWVASAPYLVWTPLPHDFPADGVAFACLGAGDEGCLFLDLAAAPGAITIGGDQAAATRLAESLAHQLCLSPAAGHVGVVVVGSALPPPPPLGAEWLPSVADLVRRQPRQDGRVEMVFCRLGSGDDVFPLARYVSSAPSRVVPIVLADLPDAPWSLTASPSALPAEVLQPVVS
jgi:hypothetical protein